METNWADLVTLTCEALAVNPAALTTEQRAALDQLAVEYEAALTRLPAAISPRSEKQHDEDVAKLDNHALKVIARRLS